MNLANKALLFSLLTAPALAGRDRVCPPLDTIVPDDRWCRGYKGPCYYEPRGCCGDLVGFAGYAECTRGRGWDFFSNEVPMCSEECNRGTSTHESTADSRHEGSTWSTTDAGVDWERSRDATNDRWSDAATGSWMEQTPDWVKTRDTSMSSDREKSTQSDWHSNFDTSEWRDRASEKWNNRKTESTTEKGLLEATWRDREATQQGSKATDDFGHVKFDEFGNPIFSRSGNSVEHKNHETTRDEWGRTTHTGEFEAGSRFTDDRHHHKATEETEVDQWGNVKHDSHSNTKTGNHEAEDWRWEDGNGNSSSKSSTKTSSSSSTKTSSKTTSRWPRRRLPRRAIVDRLAKAESNDAEPKLGDYLNQLLAPSA